MIITIFGAAGSGKSSMAISLAKVASAKYNKFVGIVATETRYGAMQRELGIKIEEKRSLKQAILDSSNVAKYATALNATIYLYAMADQDDITSHVVDDLELIDKFVTEVDNKFDVLFVDCTDRATDDITAAFLKRADKILNIVESTPKGIAYFNAHQPLRGSFYDDAKEFLVLNKNIPTNLNQSTAESLIGHKIDMVVPYITTFYEEQLETKQKSNKKYARCVEEIWKIINTTNIMPIKDANHGLSKKVQLRLPMLHK